MVLRWGTWAWSVAVVVASPERLARPWLAVLLLGAALAVNVAATAAVRAPERPPSVRATIAELTVGFVLLAAEGWVFDEGHAFAGRQGLAGGWPVVGVIAAGVTMGIPTGAGAGAVVGSARVVGALANGVRDFDADRLASLASTVIFYALYGAVAGWVGQLLARAEREVAVTRAREEVARTLHDGVLQTLALVERRTATSDPELARAARDSDRDLRAFLAGAASGASDGRVVPAVRDAAYRAARPFDLDVTVAVVDDDLAADPTVVSALAGAVGEAVTNVGKHAGVGQVVVFVEGQDDGRVFVSVRDEGTGFAPPGAERGGRGVRESIIGRMVVAGGHAEVVSAPGRGTEVRLWVS